MRTSDLIDLLAGDVRATPPGVVNRRLLAALVAGGLVTFVIVALGLHCQPLLAAVQQPWFWMKAAYTGLLTVAGVISVRRLSVPGARIGAAPLVAALIVLAMLILGTGQIFSAPPAGRLDLWLGHTWKVCSPLIFLLAAPIYVALIAALRRLAPTRPALTGAAAGFLAGAFAGTLYGLHCPEQAAAFVATWYTLGIAAATAVGGIIGARLLRW
ncbi:MAG: NrsF family protein [Steroidobacteraceae bacterium]